MDTKDDQEEAFAWSALLKDGKEDSQASTNHFEEAFDASLHSNECS